MHWYVWNLLLHQLRHRLPVPAAGIWHDPRPVLMSRETLQWLGPPQAKDLHSKLSNSSYNKDVPQTIDNKVIATLTLSVILNCIISLLYTINYIEMSSVILAIGLTYYTSADSHTDDHMTLLMVMNLCAQKANII